MHRPDPDRLKREAYNMFEALLDLACRLERDPRTAIDFAETIEFIHRKADYITREDEPCQPQPHP